MKPVNEIIYDLKISPYLVFLCGFVPLSAALIAQYVFELHPCPLCIYQRYPFEALIFLSVLSMFIKFRKFRLSVIFLSILAMLINTGISFYHFGVENKWWEFGDCASTLDTSSIEALKASLFSAPNVRCDEVQFRFIGLSMAGWNVIYCFFTAIFFLNFFSPKHLISSGNNQNSAL